jgi:hypothetical protein
VENYASIQMRIDSRSELLLSGQISISGVTFVKGGGYSLSFAGTIT